MVIKSSKIIFRLVQIAVVILLLWSCDDPLKASVIDHLLLPTPAISPSPGEFNSAQSVIITTDRSDAIINYKIFKEGELVDQGVYTTPILVGEHGKRFIVEAYCSLDNALDSNSVSAEYCFRYERVSSPVLSLNQSRYSSDEVLTISNAQDSLGAEIWVNIPQHPLFSEDSGAYRLYTEGITLTGDDKSYMINAYAQTAGLPQSLIVSHKVTIEYPFMSPIHLNPLPGSQPQAYAVSITQAQGATLWVTTDGSDPLFSSTRFSYSNPIPINNEDKNTVLRVYPEAHGYKSIPFEGEYSINPNTCPSVIPQIDVDNPNGNTFTSAELTSLVLQEERIINRDFVLWLNPPIGIDLPTGGKIFFTLTTNGAEPPLPFVNFNGSTLDPVIGSEYNPSTGIIINGEYADKRIRIKAICVAPDFTSSDPMDFDYTLVYLQSAGPSITFTGHVLSNEDQSFTVGYDTTTTARTLDQQLQYSINGGTTWNPCYNGETITTNTPPNTDLTYLVQLRVVNTNSQLRDNTSIDSQLFQVDKQAPLAPVLTTRNFHINNSVNYLNISNEETAGFNWSGEENTLHYSISGQVHRSSNSSINISDIQGNLSQSTHRIEAWFVDEAGNTSETSNYIEFIKDTISPSAPVLTARDFSNNGSINYLNVSNEGKAGFNWSGEEHTLHYSISGQEQRSSNPSVQIADSHSSLSQSAHRIEAWFVDEAGNISETSNFIEFTKDTIPPSAPVLTARDFYSNGNDSINYLNISNERIAGFNWSGEERTLRYSIGGQEHRSSNFSINIADSHSNLTQSAHRIEAWFVDEAGNTSEMSNRVEFTKNLEIPSAPPLLTARGFYVNGSRSYLNSSNAGTAGFNWTGGGSSLIYDINGLEVKTTNPSVNIADYHGSISEASHSIQARFINEAGNESGLSNTIGFTKDIEKPTSRYQNLPSVCHGIPVTHNPVILFSEEMDHNDIVNSSYYSFVPNTILVNGSYDSVTLDTTADLSYLTAYRITISNQIKDLAGNTMGPRQGLLFTTGPPSVDIQLGNAEVVMSYCSGAGASSPTPLGFNDNQTTTVAPFYIAQTEVTGALWDAVYSYAISNGYTLSRGTSHGSDHPVVDISIYDAMAWCNAASEMLGLLPVYRNGADIYKNSNIENVSIQSVNSGIRLLSNEEWECAARYIDGSRWTPGSYASGSTTFTTHNTITSQYAWYSHHPPPIANQACRVGVLLPNALSCFDMSGNTSEWVHTRGGGIGEWYLKGGDFSSSETNLQLGRSQEVSGNQHRGNSSFRIGRNY